jgi:hypothetical protein
MQKFNLPHAGQKATVVALVLFFSAIVLFSLWFTQS